MLPAKRLSPEERRLLDVFAHLSEGDRNTLTSFAEFLLVKNTTAEVSKRKPVSVPIPSVRPAEERVIAAIKRLSNSYFMLDSGRMFHETAALMTAHIVQGRAAADVIDDLERLFQDHYQRFIADWEAR